jgi:hypothetical protein
MTCDEREGAVAEVFDADDLYASPQVALAAFLDGQARFREWSIRENEVSSDTASWSFFNDAGRTVAEAKAERVDGGWAIVKWESCRGR